MSKETKITCDNCNKDITTTGAMPAYRLHLLSEKIYQDSDISYAVMVYPEIGDEYYCNLKCLKEKLAK